MRAGGAIAAVAACAVATAAFPAHGATVHQAVTLRGGRIDFFAGHLVLDAVDGATLDTGVVHLRADRIIVDLASNRCVAVGDVAVNRTDGTALGGGSALGMDLHSGAGTLIAVSPQTETFDLNGASLVVRPSGAAAPVASPTPAATSAPAGTPAPFSTPTPDPLALPDLQGEAPFASAGLAVAHLDADVRLTGARVLVPGGRDVPLPSYVYTFSAETGYSASNVAGSGEEIPIYFGSTRDSVDGAHFTYDPAAKVGIGYDHRIIDGDKAYDLFSVSPFNGPVKNADFTWQEQINAHASQTLVGSAASLSGSAWSYGANDALHRSYLELSSGFVHTSNDASLTWAGDYEPLGSGWLGQLFQYHLISSYGRSQTYASGPPIYDKSLESAVQMPSVLVSASSSLTLAGDVRYTADDSPLRQFVVTYQATVQHRWNSFLTTSLQDTEQPSVFYFPADGASSRTYFSGQTATLSYNNGGSFALNLDVQHGAEASVPAGIVTQPWFAYGDVRFRVGPTLALDLSRSYGFGYFGQRFGSFGVQLFP